MHYAGLSGPRLGPTGACVAGLGLVVVPVVAGQAPVVIGRLQLPLPDTLPLEEVG